MIYAINVLQPKHIKSIAKKILFYYKTYIEFENSFLDKSESYFLLDSLS